MKIFSKLIVFIASIYLVHSVQTQQLQQFFQEYDIDRNGLISESQIIKTLKQDDIDNGMQIDDQYYAQVASPIFQFYDANKDGQLDMKQFQFFAHDTVNEIQQAQSAQNYQEGEQSEELGQSINEEQL